jgi:hypothetical protein
MTDVKQIAPKAPSIAVLNHVLRGFALLNGGMGQYGIMRGLKRRVLEQIWNWYRGQGNSQQQLQRQNTGILRSAQNDNIFMTNIFL